MFKKNNIPCIVNFLIFQTLPIDNGETLMYNLFCSLSIYRGVAQLVAH